MALPMSVKTILYSSDEDEKLFHFDQPFRKKNKVSAAGFYNFFILLRN